MIDRVLVAMDDSELGEHALEYAIEAHPDAEITVLHVVGGPSAMLGGAAEIALADDIQEAAEERAEDVLNRAREIADEYGIEIDTAVEIGRPARAIVRRAEAFDTVVVGSHGGSLADRLFVGDVAKTVFQRSPVPVTVVR
ncbi:universal stress protein UspA [Halalkaliarchaeum desulfuricum]|uniref:Universal stress protein UspA n=1 Tax=Halalkaliarchaeum desulfuricum TaxID=2055893 RepID=A0A343TN37_9EURY|nr:universal stress protein [Halalkaliarchaeum desulfuricum]AUX10509.1 universal stress protein UspA [Halalkaliarchaeum desulfuricum]